MSPVGVGHGGQSIVLVGLRGAGKTTVGQLVAAALGRAFVDLDDLVVARAGCSITELVASQGEPAFRDLEQAALADALAASTPLVLATGGGVVTRAANRDLLRARAFVVHLAVTPELSASRVAGDPRSAATRPPLRPGGPLAEARALLAERGAWYAEVASLTVEASASPSDVAARVRAGCP